MKKNANSFKILLSKQVVQIKKRIPYEYNSPKRFEKNPEDRSIAVQSTGGKLPLCRAPWNHRKLQNSVRVTGEKKKEKEKEGLAKMENRG